VAHRFVGNPTHLNLFLTRNIEYKPNIELCEQAVHGNVFDFLFVVWL